MSDESKGIVLRHKARSIDKDSLRELREIRDYAKAMLTDENGIVMTGSPLFVAWDLLDDLLENFK